MVTIIVKCRYCGSEEISKGGTTKQGKQRYVCNNEKCPHRTFILDYSYKANDPYIRSRIYFATVNGNGILSTARTLGISKNTVKKALKAIEPMLWYANFNYIEQHKDLEIDIVSVEEAEMDEMWSYIQNKKQECWLWWAIDHNTGEPLGFCFGTREHKYLDELLELLKPFKIKTVYADGNYAYQSRISDSEVVVGKRNTQTLERKHLSLRTWCSRLVRKGIRFSKDFTMHKIVIALIINFWFFGRIIW